MGEQVAARLKRKRDIVGEGDFTTSGFRRTLPGSVGCQPANARGNRARSSDIDTGRGEQQLTSANPVSREVLLQ